MNDGTRLSYYNYTIEVKILQIYFVDSVIYLNANLFNIICLLIYIYINTMAECRYGRKCIAVK